MLLYIRIANTSDISYLKELFKNTILSINTNNYTKEEANDWASCGNDDLHWQKLISELYFIVAENELHQIVGFSSIDQEGYLHSMFVHSDFQKLGVATFFYKGIEAYAVNSNIHKITSEVSITARPFFEKQGFKVDATQKRKANKLYLTNYRMSKVL